MTLAFNEPKYEIEASAFRCHACQVEVPCDTYYFSAIFYEEEAFRRKDYCLSCWQKSAPPPGPEGVFACWRARRPPLPSEGPKRVRFETELVFQFFKRLGEEAPPPSAGEAQAKEAETSPTSPVSEKEEIRFVLALLLIRKKLLDFLSCGERDGAEWLKLSEKKEPGRVHWVKNPNLDDARIEKVKDAIGALLHMQI